MLKRSTAEKLRDELLAKGWDVTMLYMQSRQHPTAPKDVKIEPVWCQIRLSALTYNMSAMKELIQTAEQYDCDMAVQNDEVVIR